MELQKKDALTDLVGIMDKPAESKPTTEKPVQQPSKPNEVVDSDGNTVTLGLHGAQDIQKK